MRTAIIALTFILASCASFDPPRAETPKLDPRPSKPFEPALTPWQCEEILKEGGKC